MKLESRAQKKKKKCMVQESLHVIPIHDNTNTCAYIHTCVSHSYDKHRQYIIHNHDHRFHLCLSQHIPSLSPSVYTYCKHVCVNLCMHMISLYMQINIYIYVIYIHIIIVIFFALLGQVYSPITLEPPVVINHCDCGGLLIPIVSPPIYFFI